MSGVHGDIIPATARRRGSSAQKWGRPPGTVCQNERLADGRHEHAGAHPDKILPREPLLGPAGEGAEPTEKSSEQQRRESGHRGEECNAAHAQVMGFTCVPRG